MTLFLALGDLYFSVFTGNVFWFHTLVVVSSVPVRFPEATDHMMASFHNTTLHTCSLKNNMESKEKFNWHLSERKLASMKAVEGENRKICLAVLHLNHNWFDTNQQQYYNTTYNLWHRAGWSRYQSGWQRQTNKQLLDRTLLVVKSDIRQKSDEIRHKERLRSRRRPYCGSGSLFCLAGQITLEM